MPTCITSVQGLVVVQAQPFMWGFGFEPQHLSKSQEQDSNPLGDIYFLDQILVVTQWPDNCSRHPLTWQWRQPWLVMWRLRSADVAKVAVAFKRNSSQQISRSKLQHGGLASFPWDKGQGFDSCSHALHFSYVRYPSSWAWLFFYFFIDILFCSSTS